MRRPRGDAGTALLEFTVLAVLVMVPLVYVLLAAFQVQKAAFGVTEAARQAGRAYVLAEDRATGTARARVAAELALTDQGLSGAAGPRISDPTGLAPGGRVTTTVEHTVVLPVLGLLLPSGLAPRIPVRATHVQVVDEFQEGPG